MHTLPQLPYAMDALEPHISQNTLEFHYGKHHQTYVTNLNNLIKDTPLENVSIEDIVISSHANPDQQAIFNNAAQVWNHTFYWHCLTPNGGGEPSASFKKKLEDAFGSFDNFKAEFKKAALAQFGSGWAWLVLDQGVLKITKSPNAHTPLAHNQKALLTCDVWEHAYYLDYQNRRADYVDIFLDNLVNWKFAEANLA